MIISVSDTAIGYSTPQIPVFLEQTGQYFGDTDLVVFEPDHAMRPYSEERVKAFPAVRVVRVPTVQEFYNANGREEYFAVVSEKLNDLQPDVVIVANVFVLQILLHLDYRPKLVIFQSLELMRAYSDYDMKHAKRILHGGYVDLVIFPEVNRQAIDYQALGEPNVSWLVMYNSCNHVSRDRIKASDDRIDRVCFTGNFSEATFSHWFEKPALQGMALDLYGWFVDSRAAGNLPGSFKYFGALLPGDLDEVRRSYAYSLVMWNPEYANQFLASPNKFFESIAAGVPPIATPHPQCVELIERYGCGFIVPAFTEQALAKTVRMALDVYRNDKEQYASLVGGCILAVEDELNIDAQFGHVKEWLDGWKERHA